MAATRRVDALAEGQKHPDVLILMYFFVVPRLVCGRRKTPLCAIVGHNHVGDRCHLQYAGGQGGMLFSSCLHADVKI